jgi:hypothetical protein
MKSCRIKKKGFSRTRAIEARSAPERGEIALLEHDPKPGESGRPAPSSLPFSDSRAFLTSWTIWTDHFGDKDFLFALVLPSVFFFVAIGRSKIGDAH